jgi:hypothetical protein
LMFSFVPRKFSSSFVWNNFWRRVHFIIFIYYSLISRHFLCCT